MILALYWEHTIMESPFNLLKPGFVEKDVIHSQYRETVATLGIKATKCKKGLLVGFN